MKRTRFNSNTLTNTIMALFDQYPDDVLDVKEIADKLAISLRYKDKLKLAVNEMVRNNLLCAQDQKYMRANDKNITFKSNKSYKLIEGVFDATPLSRNNSYAFVKTDTGDYYVSSEDTLNAFHNDKVLIESHSHNVKNKYCYIRKIIERASNTFIGDIQKTENKYFFICNDPKIYQWFEVIDLNCSVQGDKVLLEVINWGNILLGIRPLGRVKEILGKSGNPETELLAVIKQYNLPLEFSEKVLDEINITTSQPSVEDVHGRMDYREFVTFTIDPSSAKDYDDAISIFKTNYGWSLYVHIADVAHYVKQDSCVFEECLSRGNSYYFPKKVIPMLPEFISNNLCSLRPLEDKFTITVATDFDFNGKIKKQFITESIISSNIRLSYNQVDLFFETGNYEFEPSIAQSLTEARKLSNILSNIRKNDGYLFFDLPEIEYLYDTDGFIDNMTHSIETESHKLIENFMLIANEFVANELSKKSPTLIYRIHEFPDMEKVEKLKTLIQSYGINFNYKENLNTTIQKILESFPDDTYHRVFDRMILRSLKKAKYSIEHHSHFGLAINTYTHFTSPIRRLCDLVVHHLCKQYLLKTSSSTFKKKQLSQIANIASEKELIADESERQYERVLNSIYMKSHVGEMYEGVVIDLNSTSVVIQLDNIPIVGKLNAINLPKGKWKYIDSYKRYYNERSGEYIQLMDHFKVIIDKVTDSVYLQLHSDSIKPKHHVSVLTANITNFKRPKSKKQNFKNRRNKEK